MAEPAKPVPTRVPPPSKHQLAAMIWLCVFPTLTAINVTFSDWLRPLSPVLRTFVLATIAVPIVIYALMPALQRLRVLLYARAMRRSAIGCTRTKGGVGWSYADPHAVLLDEEENLRTHRRGGSIERRPQSALVTLENTPAATPSGVQPAVRKGSR